MTDDETRVPMAGDEKVAWVYGGAVLATSGAYFVWLAIQLASHAPEDISWILPMGIAIAASIALVIVVTILASIGAAVWSAVRGRFQEPDFASDERDRAIKQLGDRSLLSALSIATGGALILAMFDASGFWIGNYIFLVCSVGALAEAGTKIRAYRRGL